MNYTSHFSRDMLDLYVHIQTATPSGQFKCVCIDSRGQCPNLLFKFWVLGVWTPNKKNLNNTFPAPSVTIQYHNNNLLQSCASVPVKT